MFDREFLKKIDEDLPFHYWTSTTPFTEEEVSFDQSRADKIPRLRQMKLNRREDNAIFVAGRAYLPARNKPTIRQTAHAIDVGLPPLT